MRTIDIRERRARLAVRHGLAAPVGSVDEAASRLVGFHSSDPVSVFVSARARVEGFVAADLEDALYERRTLVRLLGMRRTLFVVPRELTAIVDVACTKSLAPGERRRLIRMIEEQGVAPPGKGKGWLDGVMARTFEALEARGEATARELTRDVPELGAKLSFGQGTTWAGTMGVSTRVLFLLAAEGLIVRARPLGSWISGQYRWAPIDAWLGEPLGQPDRHAACATLLGDYLRAFGPVTITDVRWWTGWTAKLASTTLATLGAVEVDLDGGPAFVLPDDLRRTEEPGRWVALLPGLDATVMGWKERGWFLGEHGRALFDRNGNAGPTVWADGRAVGGWAQTADGRVTVQLLEPVDPRTRARIDTEGERLRDWLGDVRIRHRFESPLARTLRSADAP